MSIYPYEYIRIHYISMITSKKLNLEIYEVDHQEHVTIDRDITSY
jgi:hypothetical protein